MLGLSALLVITLLVIGSSCRDQQKDDPIVTVKQGKLKGAINNLLNGRPYCSFKGIPYAQAPVGELRFQAPLPPKNWRGIRNATEHGPNCPQFDANINQFVEGSEDCLHLNIYTKSLKSKTPVMVYIHGGGYISGSADTDTYGPEFLLQHDVILVTMNYRLEVLGFLSLDIPEAPGNAAMKDQVAALRWVKENIAEFGGDPDNITIFGESAGSASVTFHMLSPMSKGLFHKAIAQSGVAINDWANTSEARARAFRVGKVLGKDTKDPYELLQFLRSFPAIKLTKLTYKTRTEDEKYRGLPVHFTPVVERRFENVTAFIDKDPVTLLLENRNAIPLMIGYNSAEGLLMLEDQLKKVSYLNEQPSFYVPKELINKVSQSKMQEFGQRIKRFYVNDKDLGNDTVENIIEMQSDLHFAYNIHRFTNIYSKKTDVPVYMYRFDYESDLNILKKFLNMTQYKGACHADDLFYLFYNELNKETYAEQKSLHKIVFDLTKLWADFAITGNPTPNNSVTWHKYTPSGKEYLALNDVMKNGKYADKERMEFWDKLYCEAGVPCITKSNL